MRKKLLHYGLISVVVPTMAFSGTANAWTGDLDYYEGNWNFAQAYQDYTSTALSGSYVIAANLSNDPIVSMRIFQSSNSIVFDGVESEGVIVRSINSSNGINIIYCDNDVSHNEGSGEIVCYADEARTELFVDELNQWDEVVAVEGATFTEAYGNGSHYDGQ